MQAADGSDLTVDKMFVAAGSILFDAVYVPGAETSAAKLAQEGDAIHFINEAYRHCKPIAFSGAGTELLRRASLGEVVVAPQGTVADKGVVIAREADGEFRESFIDEIRHHRHWNRVSRNMVPA